MQNPLLVGVVSRVPHHPTVSKPTVWQVRSLGEEKKRGGAVGILLKPSPSVDFYATYYVRGVPMEGMGSPSSRGTSGWVGFFLLWECSVSISR